MDANKHALALFCCLAIAAIGGPSFAELRDPATIGRDYVGPLTPYGETPEETAAKQVVFAWNYMNMVERKPRESFEKYVSRDYCNHGHLSTGGQRECVGYEETLPRWIRNYSTPLKPGEKIEIPHMATVNGEMVTMYGQGVDIFRVHNGKVTDHWDASPPTDITIPAHTPEFTERMMQVVAGLAPSSAGPGAEAAAETLPGDIDVARWAAGNPNKRVALNYLQLVNQGKRPEAVRKYAAPTFVNHRSPMSPAAQREANAKAMAAGSQAVPPSASSGAVLKGTIGRVIAEGEYVMIHYVVTNNADIGRPLVNASGTAIGNKVGTNVVDIFKIQNGKIVEKWDAIEAIDRLELFE